MILQGIAASDGVGLGRAVCVREKKLDYSEVRYSGKDSEKDRLQAALEEFEDRTGAMAERIRDQVGKKESEILLGQITMLADPFMHSQMEEAIDGGSCAEAAVDAVCTMYAEMFAGVEDELMRQRATDVKDIRDRLLGILLGVAQVDLSRLPSGSVLVARDLTPSMTVGLNRENVVGILTETGGKTSHSAILARALELPAVLSVPRALDLIEDGDGLIVDGGEGKAILNPDESTRSEYLRRQQAFLAKRAALEVYRDRPTVDADGKVYHLYANVGSAAEAEAAAQSGAEGIGLFRTEFLFMNRASLPDETVQYEVYRAVSKTMAGKEVIIRTLDVGGDKAIEYLGMDKEDNPFLGHRAIRYCLDRPELYKVQLRALLRAGAEERNIKIMLPLITCVEEVRAARELLDQCKDELEAEGLPYDRDIKVGIMVETPSAALFIADGWFPNATIAQMVNPMLSYLLPILIAYTGGKMVGGQKGAVTGALAALGAIASTSSTMFIGAMICGPLGGWCIKKFDEKMEGHIPAGFEMVVNNFSVGIIGGLLAILSIFAIGPTCVVLTDLLGKGVGWLVEHSLLPLTAVLVEPAKVLFLNNAINHGVFTPIGTEQVEALRAAGEVGKSILYMIESNPGPGLGLLLAYCVAGQGEARSSAGAAALIQFVGGIHEIYFPYVLMNPVVILGPMAGNVCGIFILSLLGGGLSGPASPGSIIAEMLMTPKGCYLANIVGIAVAGAVSFAVSVFLLKFFGKDASLGEAQAQVAANKAASKGQAVPAASGSAVDARDVKKIVFACDAGMGSSAMGATMLRNKLKDAGVTGIEVIHHPVSEIPGDCQVVVTHHELSGRAAQRAPQARIIPIHNFMGAPEYDTLVEELLQAQKGMAAPAPADEESTPPAGGTPILLERKNIVLGCASVTPEDAIRACGRLMVESGCVDENYIQGMLDREASFSVAIGSHVAIPHGTNDVKPLIKKTGVVVMTYPDGIDWNGDKVKLVVGIAAKGEEHLEVLGRIVAIASTDEDTDRLVAGADAENLFLKLNGLG